MTLYHCDDCGEPVAAEDPDEAAKVFAQRLAIKNYGPSGTATSLNLIGANKEWSVFEYSVFLGLWNGNERKLVGQNFRLTVKDYWAKAPTTRRTKMTCSLQTQSKSEGENRTSSLSCKSQDVSTKLNLTKKRLIIVSKNSASFPRFRMIDDNDEVRQAMFNAKLANEE